ncbi:endo alpha-1,4 polygalactosaminidase [Microbulbifer litoralis]|uniref:endo alpha-1,4 polygalactosaminidase n=1 Tax=Microbulbifer litoralis TaxID=2933965 RepID=UPI0020284197|nr:endo alpha-1,4 polygalactosaminidase [Microbulbifer sp. GX H0434]
MSKINIVQLVILSAALLAGACRAETLYVDSINVSQGQISNQPIEVLKTQDQAGQQDNWSTYLEAAPGSARFVGQFLFNAPSPQPGTSWQSLALKVNTIGEAKAAQRWVFQLRDFVDGKWVTLGDNAGAANWQWYAQNLVVQQNPERYINASGLIKVRYRSNNNLDVSNVDLMTIELQGSEQGGGNGDWWKPTPAQNLTWQWQINGTLDTSFDVDMYDVDLFDTPAAQIQDLKDQGRTVICYFSAGTYEGWREDWQLFFPFITDEQYTGNEPPFAGNMADWDERWLDIRRIDLLTDIMGARLDLAVSKGCDGVEPDNMDAYTNGDETGLPLIGADQLAYNRWIAQEAHARGLSVGLKNDVGQLADLVGDFDWALNEQCFEYNECSGYQVFINAGKAVFGVEYTGEPAQFCPQANNMNLSWLKKQLSLNSWRIGCEDY